MENCKVDTIRQILDTSLSDEDKLYFMRAYLDGHLKEEHIQMLIEFEKRKKVIE